MEIVTEPKKRNSRGDMDEPAIRNGKIVEIRPTERMLTTIFPLLDQNTARDPWPYEVQPVNYLAKLSTVSWSEDYLSDQLPILVRAPNYYLRRPDPQDNFKRGVTRFGVFAHADTALSGPFWHQLMGCMYMGNIELGARQDPDFFIANFDRITSARSFPANGSHSRTMEVKMPERKDPVPVRPDWDLFGIGKSTPDGKRPTNFYLVEFDTGSEPPRDRKQPNRKTLEKMINRYLEIDKQDLPKKLYGIPKRAVHYLFITALPGRVQLMINILNKHTNSEGHPRFLFDFFPTYNSHYDPPLPDGAAFRTPKKRAGHPEFFMNQL